MNQRSGNEVRIARMCFVREIRLSEIAPSRPSGPVQKKWMSLSCVEYAGMGRQGIRVSFALHAHSTEHLKPQDRERTYRIAELR